MKKIIAIILVLTLSLGLLAACGNKVLTQEQALKVVAKDLGVSMKDFESADVHVTTVEVPAYAIYVTVDGHHYAYMIAAAGGEILASEETEHGHSH